MHNDHCRGYPVPLSTPCFYLVSLGDIYTPSGAAPRALAVCGALLAMLTVALTSALLAKFVELKYNEQATMICLVNVVVMVLQVAIGWSWRQDYSHARTEAAARLLQIVWRFRRKGVMLWS